MLLGLVRQSLQGGFAFGGSGCPVLHHVLKADATMCSDPAEGDGTLLQQFDQVRPGYIEQVGGFLGGYLRVCLLYTSPSPRDS